MKAIRENKKTYRFVERKYTEIEKQ